MFLPLQSFYDPKQNYLRKYLRNVTVFKTNGFTLRKAPPPVQSCFLQTPWDQAFFGRHNNTVSRGSREGTGRIATATMFRKNALQLWDFIKILSKIATLVYFFTILALEFKSPFSLRQSFGGKSSSARIYSQGVGSNLLVSSVLLDLFEKFVTMVSIV